MGRDHIRAPPLPLHARRPVLRAYRYGGQAACTLYQFYTRGRRGRKKKDRLAGGVIYCYKTARTFAPLLCVAKHTARATRRAENGLLCARSAACACLRVRLPLLGRREQNLSSGRTWTP